MFRQASFILTALPAGRLGTQILENRESANLIKRI